MWACSRVGFFSAGFSLSLFIAKYSFYSDQLTAWVVDVYLVKKHRKYPKIEVYGWAFLPSTIVSGR